MKYISRVSALLNGFDAIREMSKLEFVEIISGYTNL
jgi:hypothetical protein